MEATAAPSPMNVRENWPIYDTIQIRSDAKEKEGYPSFVALSAIDEVPFFDQRKADVGIAYTNRDSNEALEYVYNLKKIGVMFRPHHARTPPFVEMPGGEVYGADNPISSALFMHLMDHCGAILKIREDNKLIATVPLMPEGGGISGFVANNAWPVVAANNGWPDERNGYWFSGEGIAIPRGATFNVRLRFSTYAKRLLANLIGPPSYSLNLDPEHKPPIPDVLVPACSLIRVQLNGWRGVQQRGELHY
jgi:hypothetical protein